MVYQIETNTCKAMLERFHAMELREIEKMRQEKMHEGHHFCGHK